MLTLTLDRPAQLNALTGELSDALAAELEAAAAYDDVRVVVLRGAGRAFCAGADIAGADASTRLDVRALDRANRIIRAITRLDKPVLAAVQGPAAGVGCSIALACDLAVAAESASFLLAFARIGLMPDGGSSSSVAASIGRARAMRMALLAEPLTGREAFEAGLVSHLADDDAFETVVAEVTSRLAAGAPLAQAATKRAVNAAAYCRAGRSAGARAHRPDDAAEHPRRSGRYAGVRRTADPGVRGGLMQQLRKALEARDPEAVEALLAGDVVFRSPALFKPYVGRAATMVFLRAAMETLDDLCYVQTFSEADGRGHVLMFTASVDGRALEGADFVTLDESGLVSEFRVMIRPMTGLVSLAQAMAPRIEGPLAALSPE